MSKKNDTEFLDELAGLYKWPSLSKTLEARIVNASKAANMKEEKFWDRLFDVFSFRWEPALVMGVFLLLGLGLGQVNAYQNSGYTQRNGLYQDSSFYMAHSIIYGTEEL